METRLYFLVGDALANAGSGAVVALVSTALFGDAWPLAVGMIAGMLVGGIVAVPLAMVASVCFGAFEVMLPVMTTGMFVGMMTSMEQASSDATIARGAGLGLGVLVVTYVFNTYLRAKGGTWTF